MANKFQTFTGSSRRPRNVNLSGNNNNPFAAVSGSKGSAGQQNSRDAVLHAQQEREARRQERERLKAAKSIQKTWRGHRTRKEIGNTHRRQWDYREGVLNGEGQIFESYVTSGEALAQLRLLVQFASPLELSDLQRIQRFQTRSCKDYNNPIWFTFHGHAHEWTHPLLRSAKLCLAFLQRSFTGSPLPVESLDSLLSLLCGISRSIPDQMVPESLRYYTILSRVLRSTPLQSPLPRHDSNLIEACALALLSASQYGALSSYEGLAEGFLTTPGLGQYLNLDGLARGIDLKILATGLNNVLLSDSGSQMLTKTPNEDLLWLLAHFIYLGRTVKLPDKSRITTEADFVSVVSMLLSFLANEIGSRLDSIESTSTDPLPPFISGEMSILVNQEDVTGLLSHFNPTSLGGRGMDEVLEGTAALASYALTLLRVFPRRADEIRMWLYLGSTTKQTGTNSQHREQLPAIKFFWEAVRQTRIFRSITQDPNNAVELLQTNKPGQLPTKGLTSHKVGLLEQEWRILMLFLELYTFVLKVMDDEEFMNGASPSSQHQSWTRRSALELSQVNALTIFLKNLAFSMYWNDVKITGLEEPVTTTSLAEYFGTSSVVRASVPPPETLSRLDDVVAGLSGLSLSYLKDMVTGLLRMVYERDSRRNFLPKGHWLMTKYFEMEGFISAVVSEENYKHEHQDADNDDDELMRDELDEDNDEEFLIGTHRTQQVRRIERLKRQQRKTARRKLEKLTPRLKILQNMPFFIPFTTRVEIFHEFVSLDQAKRRGGVVDPDLWRMSMHRLRGEAGLEDLSKHHAKIRRERCFEDAYSQFFKLGEGLKEPIQITFVDQFDTVEAGIDGGGVTKEFLTSVTSEAFAPSDGPNLFVENDQHLLYPNPAAMEERKDILRQVGLREGSPEWNEPLRDLLQQYEFLGRVVGKCLYEGILIDIHFAPFFLVKWALTGGSRSATNESSYRANINDLRDLDEALYQGLLKLKNDPGNVEDFSLDFTITDTISTPEKNGGVNGQTTQRTITRELRKNGSQIPVTNENRLVYISYVARHRLQIQPHQQTNAFLRGLGAMIEASWLSMFNQSELQTLVGGDSSEIDVSDLRRNTHYGGVYVIGDDNEEHPTIAMFWEVLKDFSDTDRRKVLKYVTSTPRAPLLGFSQLNPRFSIRDSGNDQTRLPSTSTCVNLLKLPIYGNKNTLREKLRYAIDAGAGFNLS